MLNVLRVEAYRKLFTAQIIALLGTGLLTVALGLLAYDLAGGRAGAVLGTALTIKMVAYVLMAPVMTALVERLPRKAVLVGADLVRAAIALTLPFIDQTWQIYLLVFILQSASATFTPTFQALIPVILPNEKDYTRALSLSRLAYDLESLLSPILAAALLTVMTFHFLFMGTVAGFLLSAALVLTTGLPQQPVMARVGSFLHRTTSGTRIFLTDPSLRGLMALNLVVACGTALVLVNTVVYSLDVFGGSNIDLAVALACYGAGSMIVALAVPRILDRVPDRSLMVLGGAILPVGLVAAAAIVWTGQSWELLLVLWMVLGGATSMINTPSARLLRQAATDSTRTYLYTAQFSLSHSCFMLTYPIAGWVGAIIGQPAAALVLAGLATVGVLAALRLWPRSRRPLDEETPTAQVAQ